MFDGPSSLTKTVLLMLLCDSVHWSVWRYCEEVGLERTRESKKHINPAKHEYETLKCLKKGSLPA